MIYLIILLFTFIPVLLFDFLGKNKGWRFWYYAELIVLILLAGLRYRIGGDTLAYIDYFDTYPTVAELFYFDFSNAYFNPLWYIFNAVIKSIWNNFFFFQLIQAIIVNCIFFVFFKKYTKYFFSSVFIYYLAFYLYFNMDILREILAICVFMLSFGLLQNKKYIKYFLCSIIAIGFHYSAMIMFIIPLFLLIPKISWRFTFCTFFLLVAILNIYDMAPFLAGLFVDSEVLNVKVMTYLLLEGHTTNVNGTIAYLTPILLLMYVNRNNQQDNISNKIQNLLFLYVILIGLSIFYAAMFTRMQNYIVPFYIIYMLNVAFPVVKNKINKYSIQGYIVKFAICWFLFFNFTSYFKDRSNFMYGYRQYNIYYPYHSVLNPVEDAERERFIEIIKQN